jgi:hypothetical protein
MTPADIDRVFGRGRVRMVTGEHVEVFREASRPGERRRYTKRFLATAAGDFREWTEREWRILARLVGHGVRAVPQVVQFDRGAADRAALVQTYDAGVTVDHWATLLPLERDGIRLRNVFEDCAHWWALARHCLVALDAIHALQLVHLDLKADNVCVPIAPADFDPLAAERSLRPRFDELALIDFAFSLVSGEPLESALPIARQAEYEYQSPRLLRALDAGRCGNLAPTRELDWRCDLFSLAAMLWRYLPELEDATYGGWTRARHAKARALTRRLVEAHDNELPAERPHAELIAFADDALAQPELAESLQRGFDLVVDSDVSRVMSPTPVTRIAAPVIKRAATEATPVAATSPTPATVPPAIDPARATASGAAPWFFSAGDPIGIDPTDIEARAFLRSAAPAKRSRKAGAIAGALALVAAAAACVPLLAPDWLVLPGAHRDTPKLARAPVSRTPPPAPVVAAATPQPSLPEPGAPPSAAPKAETDATKPTPSPAATPVGLAKATAVPAKGAPSTADNAKPVTLDAARPATKSQALARGTRGASNASTAVPIAAAPTKALLARNARAPVPPAPAAAAASGRARPQLAAASPTPQRAPLTRTWHDPASPVPWAVAGRTLPHLPPAKPIAVARAPAATTRAGVATTAATTGATTAADGASIVAAQTTPSTASTSPAATPVAPATVTVAAVGRDLQSAPSAFPGVRGRDAAAATPGDGTVDLVGRANDVMTNHVPRLAQEAQRSVARVLYAAGRSEHVRDDDDLRASAAAVARSAGDPLGGMTLLPRDAQRLNDQARAEYARHGPTSDVLMLQVRAFGANPMDAEVAGNLAFLLLRQRPAQAEAARQLALHALTLRNTREGDARIEDWATFAIASALTGRERDARNALLVTLALAPSLERQCKAALDVVALYGERLRAPVEAMLQSAQSSRAGQQSAFCEYPPHWVVSGAR